MEEKRQSLLRKHWTIVMSDEAEMDGRKSRPVQLAALIYDSEDESQSYDLTGRTGKKMMRDGVEKNSTMNRIVMVRSEELKNGGFSSERVESS